MTKLALFVRLEAKPGQEAALADFLASALPLANAESGTTAWFALKFGPSTFGRTPCSQAACMTTRP